MKRRGFIWTVSSLFLPKRESGPYVQRESGPYVQRESADGRQKREEKKPATVVELLQHRHSLEGGAIFKTKTLRGKGGHLGATEKRILSD